MKMDEWTEEKQCFLYTYDIT